MSRGGLVVWWRIRSPVGAAEGCDLLILILIFSNLQIAKAKSKDRSLRQLLHYLFSPGMPLQTLAQIVLQLSTNLCDYAFSDCRAGVAVFFLAALFGGLTGLHAFPVLRCVADIKADCQVQGDCDSDSDDDLADPANFLF